MSVITAPGWTRAVGYALIPGGAAGDHTLSGPIDPGDDLIAVKHVSVNLVTNADITAEFTIDGTGLINNAAGTDTTGNFLVVVWARGTP